MHRVPGSFDKPLARPPFTDADALGKLVEYRKADAQGKGVPVTDSEGKTVEGQYLITWPLNNNGVEKDMLVY